jgi:hypothetical protein
VNRRDVELLDRLLWGVSPCAKHSGGSRVLALAAVFMVGLVAGGALFSPQRDRLSTASSEGPTSVFLLDAAQ